MSEQYEFDFDAPLWADYVSAPSASEVAQGVEEASACEAEDAEAGEIHNETDINADIDAPLFGAEEDNAEGWKSVDFRVDDGDADTGSGGGNMPPPENHGTASDNNASEPEHSRSTPGAPSTALITLKSEHSEHSEYSEYSENQEH